MDPRMQLRELSSSATLGAMLAQTNGRYPVALPNTVDSIPNSISDEREKVSQALVFSDEVRQQLTEALVSLFERIASAGVLREPLEHLMPAPPQAVDTVATQPPPEPPPNSAAAAALRQIRDRVSDGNGALIDMVGAITRVRNAIDI